MGSFWYFFCIFLLIFSILPLYRSQSSLDITKPQLTNIVPVNSTALTVNWQFANSSIDKSDLIRVYIYILEYYTKYNTTIYSTNYTFTTNRTITSWTQNFQLVNAFYSVCFSSNSTITNSTTFVAETQCKLARTCSRGNSSVCPNASAVTILSSGITSNSFLITVNWYNILPITRNSTVVQISSENLNGTFVSMLTNDTYMIETYQFSNRQAQTTYLVNTIITYTLLNQLQTETYTLSVTTSRSAQMFLTSDMFIYGVSLLTIFLIKLH